MKTLILQTLTFLSFFIFTASLAAQVNNTWTGAVNGFWNVSGNWDMGIPDDNDVIINLNQTVTYSITENSIESITMSNGADLIIQSGNLLSLTKNGPSGGDCIQLNDAGTSLTIEGSMMSSGFNGDGLDQNAGCTVSITGTYTVDIATTNASSDDAIEIGHDFSNSGSLTVQNTGGIGMGNGISVKSSANGRFVTNSGTLIISDTKLNGITLEGSASITNTGIAKIADTAGNLIDGTSGSFINNGTFIGDGTINSARFDFGTGTITPGQVSPGPSVGTLTFDGNVAFDVANSIEFEINDPMSNDKIIVNGNVNLNSVNLILTNVNPPSMGESFDLLELTGGGVLSGTFNGIAEGDPVTYDGGTKTLYISYLGNKVTASFDALMPVELISFNAQAMEDEVKLAWATATEINNDFFTIERSTDGRNFEAIATILGNGNTTELSKYDFMDRNPQSGLNYYRLKQTDYDGQFSYSDIETIQFENEDNIKIYPSLVYDVLTVEIGADIKDAANVIIRDLTGRIVKQFEISRNKSQKEIIMNDLIPGNYFISIYNNEILKTKKLLKL